jgi:hypothetical protein
MHLMLGKHDLPVLKTVYDILGAVIRIRSTPVEKHGFGGIIIWRAANMGKNYRLGYASQSGLRYMYTVDYVSL